ncbi:hypothetical protein E4U32_002310 [Claviceps aff. humidiphila group G2b]|nr:hypothetical protein E4U32_002310 [Claviceps aff. humidiphila group G2b]
MDIDSGTRGLAQSRHHPLSGLGNVNVETVSPEANAVRERVPQQLRTDFDIIARLVQPSALEGVWKACQSMLNAEATRVGNATTEPRRSAPSILRITIENLDQSVEKAIQKALRASPKGPEGPRRGEPHGPPSLREAPPALRDRTTHHLWPFPHAYTEKY